ncbi:MAG: ATP-binding protein [Deltaproteobacteria bacterium]|nr:ATP-binding protein [Deltaproteobacteria bacterium]
MTDRVLLQLSNSDAELTEFMRAAEEFLRRSNLAERTVYVASLALEEILTNIIKYAYDDSEEHLIHVDLNVSDEEILIECQDDGREFDPLSVPPPQTPHEIADYQPGGLGIHLVRRLSESMEYKRSQNRNMLRIRIRKW